jgi:hypothetical protein
MSKVKLHAREKDSSLKVIRGKKNKYIGLAGKSFSCPSCPRTFKHGMVSEYKNVLYCSENCIPD